ncbi:MAG: hypothetical protein ABIH71_05420 [Candidatus Omnitrophota bacterium]|nr:hypothetical protein [Candidatus Omnitrophota bacterium]
MKYIKLLRIIIGIFLLGVISCSNVPSKFKSNSEPNGYSDLKWGTNLTALTDMVKIRTDPFLKVDIYTRKNESLKKGMIKFKRIEYAFWKNKFKSVSFCIEKGYWNWLFLKIGTFKKYGKGVKHKMFEGVEYLWQGEKTNAILLRAKSKTSQCGGVLVIESVEIQKQITAYLKNSRKGVR